MNFKIGDMVWCVDPSNRNGLYTVTCYHRPCVVEKVNAKQLYVRVADPRPGRLGDRFGFWVDRKLFQLVHKKGSIV